MLKEQIWIIQIAVDIKTMLNKENICEDFRWYAIEFGVYNGPLENLIFCCFVLK